MSEKRDKQVNDGTGTEVLGTFPLEISGSGEDDLYSQTMVIESDTPTAEQPAPEPDQRLQTGSVLRDRYLLQDRITGGSMGVVYKALDRHMADADGEEAAVAVKVLTPQLSRSPEALRALQQEAAKGRCLTHPHIVRFIDLDREDHLYFLVMEWLEGRSLAEVLDSGTPAIDISKAIDIVRQVGEALSYAHRRGVIHADVKPGNIMLLEDGSVKLIDFGIARVRQRQDMAEAYETGSLRAATPAYSSMQVLTGEEPTASDDVFSLACLAYRLIAGHRVFGPRNAAEAAEEGMEPQRPQGLSDAQWKALRKGLSRSRVTRQASPMELVDGLMGMAGAAAAAPPPPPAEPPQPERPAAAAKEPAPGDTEGDISLSIPREAFIERRYETTPSRSWVWVLLVLAAVAAGALILRPDWRETALTTGTALVTDIREMAGFSTYPRPAPGYDETVGAGDAGQGQAGSADEPAAAARSDQAASEPEAAAPVAGPDAEPENDSGTADESAADMPIAETQSPETDSSESPDPAPAAGAGVTDTDRIMAEPPGEGEAQLQAERVADGPNSLVLAAPGEVRPQLAVTLTEDGDDLTVVLHRWFRLAEPLLVRVDEVGFSGSRSPGESGDYRLSGDGVISFDPDQEQASLTISARSDDTREPDRQISLLLRDYYNPESELAAIDLRLVDDDQRSYETDVTPNSVAFTTGRVIVHERDPAAQIDVVRNSPDDSPLTVRYTIRDLSATEGEDYFVPGQPIVRFGPGQRSARLLIPLVQDNIPESDENFLIELDEAATDPTTISRVAVIIRDDD